MKLNMGCWNLNARIIARPTVNSEWITERKGANSDPVGASRGWFIILRDTQLIFPIEEIVHPTDFSALSKKAFVHALRLALNAHCKLSVIHVDKSKTIHEETDKEIAYLFLSRILSQWRLGGELNSQYISAAALGFQIEHIESYGRDLVDMLADHVRRREPQLIVLGTHERTGLDQLLKGSISETLFSRTSASTLFISPHTRGFVNPVTGEIKLRRVLLPVDHSPTPGQAIRAAREFGRILIGHEPMLDLVHIGTTAPEIVDVRSMRPRVILRPDYDAAKGIIEAAAELAPDMICMATAGRHGLLDALRGSTTQRVLREAPCPVLATGC